MMEKNPFDEQLSVEAKERVTLLKSFHQAQINGAELVHTNWIRIQRERKRKARLERTLNEHPSQDAETRHKELTDAHESASDLQLTETVKAATTNNCQTAKPPDTYFGDGWLTGRTAWGGIVTLIFVVAWFCALSESLWAVLWTPIFILGWAAVTRLSLLFFGGGSWGSSRGASGNAV